jgi:hypothetical protein
VIEYVSNEGLAEGVLLARGSVDGGGVGCLSKVHAENKKMITKEEKRYFID